MQLNDRQINIWDTKNYTESLKENVLYFCYRKHKK